MTIMIPCLAQKHVDLKDMEAERNTDLLAKIECKLLYLDPLSNATSLTKTGA